MSDAKKNTPLHKSDTSVDIVMKTLKSNKAKALGLAVLLTTTTSLAGCSGRKAVDDSYYQTKAYNRSNPNNPNQTPAPASSSHGGGGHVGSYYYSRGGTYKSGSWGNGGGSASIGSSSVGSSSYARGAGG